MPLSWNEIKSRAIQFSKEWENEKAEHAEAKTFWDDFFNVFGIHRRRVATFEQRVFKETLRVPQGPGEPNEINRKGGFIDLLWKGHLLIEHKSGGGDLDRAYQQAKDYFPGPKAAIEQAAQKVLDVRKEFEGSSLADLYDPVAMPPKLTKAHQDLDKAVDLAYRSQPFTSETKRIEFLFELYEKYTNGLFGEKRITLKLKENKYGRFLCFSKLLP